MTGAGDVLNLSGKLDELRHAVAAEVLGVALPEMLKDGVEGMGELWWGPEIAQTVVR